MTLEVRLRKRVRAEPRTRWWKLKEEDCCVKFREGVRQVLDGGKEVWTTGQLLQKW